MSEKFCLNENKLLEAKKILAFKNKKIFSTIFNLFEEDIKKMLTLGYSRSLIVDILSKELETNIKYITFIKWFDKNIKQKNQSSNTLKNNSQIKKHLNKQNNTASTTSNTPKEDDGKPWWKRRVEELSRGMKEAGVRR